LYNATLTVGTGALLAIPDVPASLFWTATLWAAVRAWRGDGRWWLLAGAAAGLACLSKYSALFMAPGVVLWLATTRPGRRQLARPWPWAAALVAVAIFAANVWWNAGHHWLTFEKQFGRVSPGRFAPRYLVELVATQFLLLNPAVAILAGLGAVRAWRERETREGGVAWLMAASSAPFAAYLVLHSLHDRVQAHWPVPLYPAAALLAAWTASQASGWRRGLARWAPAGIALTTLALAYMAAPVTWLGKGDPASQLRGWSPFAAQVDRVRAQDGAAWVGALSYGVDGQLQTESALRAPVLQINERERYADLPAAAPDFGRPGLVVDLLRRIDRRRLAACFENVGPTVEIDRGGSHAADARYGAILVSAPKVDLLGHGCDD
jgi:4-amino-4-deoxy-L-arabinose transferase-like glycosyltransferase